MILCNDLKFSIPSEDVEPGDVIVHKSKMMYVLEAYTDNSLRAVDIFDSESKELIPVTNMFGFSFVTRIVSMFNMDGEEGPSRDKPFGNIAPLIMLSGMKDGENSLVGGDIGKMMYYSLILETFVGRDGNNPLAGMFNFGKCRSNKSKTED